MRRKTTCALGIVLLMAGLAACRSAVPQAEVTVASQLALPGPTATGEAGAAEALPEGSIAILLPPGGRWDVADRPAFAACLDAAGVDYTFAAPDTPQPAAAEAAIAAGAKVLILAHSDQAAGAAVIAAARAAGIQVIDYERLTTGPPADVHVGFDQLTAGRLIGETMSQHVNALPTRRRNVILLGGPLDDLGAAQRREGLLSVIQLQFDNGRWTLLGNGQALDAIGAQTVVADLLSGTTSEIGAVLADEDALAGGATAALAAAGRETPLLSGSGATQEAVRRIMAGEQTMTVYMPPRLAAEAACQAAVAMLNGDDPTTFTVDTLSNGSAEVLFIHLRPLVITEDNVGETVVADGVYSWEEICAGVEGCGE